LADLFQVLAPWCEALLRAVAARAGAARTARQLLLRGGDRIEGKHAQCDRSGTSAALICMAVHVPLIEVAATTGARNIRLDDRRT
jgi:hypothetical protein